jgi:hypothetical protein
MYKLHTFNLGFGEETNVILDNGNGKFVSFPQDPNNENYQAYLKWLELGNTPEPADTPA